MSNLARQICFIHPTTSFLQVDYPEIYVADFSERTKMSPHKRSVEITDYNQMAPDGGTLMDSAAIHNDGGLSLEFSLLHDTLYTSTITSNNQHCEGCFYLENDANRKWMVFFELKDCLPENISKHKRKAKKQIENVVKDFNGHSLIDGLKLFGIISCPRKKVSFNDTILGDMFAARAYKRRTGITLYGTNEVFVMNENNIRPVI
ncbi:MAG: hypothetical protein MJZ84_02340 [Paludibacteraceae bacterium]|nr:hypothetical protein [Paludibacteraceae bacterium]